jgi:hypothetical protein
MFRTAIATITLAGSLLFSAHAQAQQVMGGAVCGERSNFLSHLGKNHQEAPSAMGVTASGRVIEVLTSSDGTWTIIMTHPNGMTCMVAAGKAWENIERIALGPAA